MTKISFLLRTSGGAIAMAAIVNGTPAVAQATAPAPTDAQPAPPTQPDQADATSDKGGDIVVTGSRLGRTGYDAPTPVNVVGDDRLKKLNIQNIGDALNQIPSFRPINGPATNSFRVSGAIGARTLDLRGLGATRTLTLVDGRRFVSSSENNTVDLNSIPSIIVQRAEVVTGGASAAYGANAVSGVVNLILDTKLNGFKADFNAGITERGDGGSYYAGLAGGTDFAQGRGHIVAAFEYSQENGLGACEVRAWCAKYTNYVSNPGYNTATRTSTNGLPATLVLNGVMFTYNENGILTGAVKPNGSGGTITLGQQVLNVGATSLPAALRGKQFDSNGNLVPYTFGNFLSGSFQQFPSGSDPTQPYLLGLSPSPLVVPTKHIAAMTHAEYKLSDSITASVEFMFSRVTGGPTRSTPPLDDKTSLDINNPYISNATRATILGADPTITRVLVSHSAYDIAPNGLAIGTSTNDTYRGALTLKGDLGAGWAWDAYYTYGRVDGNVVSYRTRTKEWNDAVDAVLVTAGNVGTSGLALGSIVCRTTLTKPTNGCIPINLFGTISQAAADRYLRTATQTRRFEQNVAAVNLRGSPFSTWAGDVKVATGGEYRIDTARGNADPLTLAGAFIQSATTALPYTKTTVAEGYAEIGVPLLKDSALGKAFDVDGAVRYTKYNKFGSAWTWKVGGVYTPIPDITFRVTKSRDIRAPTALESSPNATTTQLPLADPFVGGTTLQLVVAGGNPNLKLERASTFTAGVVLKPSFVPRFNMSIDYYNIKVAGAIDSLTPQVIATACKNQNLLCNLIQFNPNGSINTIFTTSQNLSQLHAEGFELVADYRIPAFGGNIDLQVNGNYVVDLSTLGATGVSTQLDGVTGNSGSVTNIVGVPRWKLDGVISFSKQTWGVSAHMRYIPQGILDSTKIGPEQPGYDINDPNSISTNIVDSRFYLDLSARVSVTNNFEFYASMNNVFDKGEPKQLRFFGNGLHFDPYGRAFKIGARIKY
jgi:outer membrane receptor protein involved in Fe transport